MAAHLHDSVLQTLALIQRSDDPARMAILARHQETSCVTALRACSSRWSRSPVDGAETGCRPGGERLRHTGGRGDGGRRAHR